MINRLPLEYRLPQAKANVPHNDEPGPGGRARALLEKAAQRIGDHPTASLAATFVLGLVFGWVVKRR